MNTIGETIKILRIRKGFTQKKLAEYSNVSAQIIGKYERGDTQPEINNLIKIADTLGRSVECLIIHTSYESYFNSEHPKYNGLKEINVTNIKDLKTEEIVGLGNTIFTLKELNELSKNELVTSIKQTNATEVKTKDGNGDTVITQNLEFTVYSGEKPLTVVKVEGVRPIG